jgi:hypothetical protein
MAGTKFNDIYLRSSLTSDGTIPDNGSYHESPDIFSNGMEPFKDFATVLATPVNYKVQPEDKSITNRDNYCYLRCKNDTSEAVSAKAELFYTTATVVAWPDNWIPMEVDVKGTTLNDIKDIQPGAIGVVERPFIWNKPVELSTGNHYCLIGRLSTEKHTNPIPDVHNPIQMAQIIQTNLMYTQRNIETITIDPGADGGYQTTLNVQAGISSGTHKYHLFFYSGEMDGWDVEITCSMRDSNGNKIGLARTPIKNDLDIYCGQCMLEPGFTAVASVYFYSNGNAPKVGAKTKLTLEYASGFDELEYARSLNVLNIERSNRLKALGGISHDGALVTIGGYTAHIISSSMGK